MSLDVFGDYIESVSRGDRLDWYVGPFAQVEWNSGESLSGYLQCGRSFVDEAFDLADRLPVPVGDYVANWKSIFFSTSSSRPLVLGASADWQESYGGHTSSLGADLEASLGSHLSLALGYERSKADLPSGSFVADVVSVRLGYAFSTRMAAGAYVQWNSLDEHDRRELPLRLPPPAGQRPDRGPERRARRPGLAVDGGAAARRPEGQLPGAVLSRIASSARYHDAPSAPYRMSVEKNARAFLSVLAEAHLSRSSGIVRVTDGDARLAVALQAGKVVALEAEASADAPSSDEDQELAALLAEAFIGGEPAVSRAAARQTLLEGLRSFSAQAVFEAGASEGADPPLEFPTEELLREAAHLADAPLVEEALGDLDRPLVAAVDPRELQEKSLTPSEGYLLSRLDGSLTARGVLALLPLEAEAARRNLLGLLVGGLVRFASPTPKPVASPLAGKNASPPPDPEMAAREARRLSIREAHARIVGERNHYTVLGLTRDATDAEVKAAYFGLAKRFHPDTLAELSDLHDTVEAIFTAAGRGLPGAEPAEEPRRLRGDAAEASGRAPCRSRPRTATAPALRPRTPTPATRREGPDGRGPHMDRRGEPSRGAKSS